MFLTLIFLTFPASISFLFFQLNLFSVWHFLSIDQIGKYTFANWKPFCFSIYCPNSSLLSRMQSKKYRSVCPILDQSMSAQQQCDACEELKAKGYQKSHTIKHTQVHMHTHTSIIAILCDVNGKVRNLWKEEENTINSFLQLGHLQFFRFLMQQNGTFLCVVWLYRVYSALVYSHEFDTNQQ